VQGRNERLRRAGLDDDATCAALINPGFTEVFGLDESTLDNPQYRLFGISLMQGKLDWLLHRGIAGVASCAIGNHDYAASDHKWLSADLTLVADDQHPSSQSNGSCQSASSPRIHASSSASAVAGANGSGASTSHSPGSDVTSLGSPRSDTFGSPRHCGTLREGPLSARAAADPIVGVTVLKRLL
jgi:hypothetical protein